MMLEAPEAPESTEQSIKKAARIVFLKKGLDQARTQEIADLAAVNHSLIPYYFKSKQKLFDIILAEVFNEFIAKVEKVVNDGNTNFETKVYLLVDRYSEMVLESPYLPLYSITVIRKGNSAVTTYTKQMRIMLHHSVMARQLKQEVEAGKFKPATLAQVIMNILSLTLFPALAAPVLQTMGDMKEEHYIQLIESRQKHIAEWVLHTLR